MLTNSFQTFRLFASLSRRERLMLLSGLVSAVTLCNFATPGQAAPSSSRHAAPHTGAKKTTFPRSSRTAPVKKASNPLQAKGEEDILVGSHRQALNGGGGMMRLETAPHAVQTVTKAYINMRSPTSTALDLVKNLPSLNIMAPDSSGMEGGQIQSRGLTDLDMALMVDGAPAAAAKYMTEDIDSENLEEVSVAPGSAARDLPVMSAAGGVMNSRTHLPSNKLGGMMDFSYGTVIPPFLVGR